MTLLEKFREYARLLRIGDGRGAAIFYELHKQDSKFDAVARIHAGMTLGILEGIREARRLP